MENFLFERYKVIEDGMGCICCMFWKLEGDKGVGKKKVGARRERGLKSIMEG